MAFFKPVQQKINSKWYPRSIVVGKPVTTDQVADKLAEQSTVTRGDAYAVMKNLGSVLATYMANGRSVKINGVGTFYYSAISHGTGVDVADEVSAKQITATRVRFIPEVGHIVGTNSMTRSLISNELFWEKLNDSASATTDSGNSEGDGSGGTTEEEENPFG